MDKSMDRYFNPEDYQRMFSQAGQLPEHLLNLGQSYTFSQNLQGGIPGGPRLTDTRTLKSVQGGLATFSDAGLLKGGTTENQGPITVKMAFAGTLSGTILVDTATGLNVQGDNTVNMTGRYSLPGKPAMYQDLPMAFTVLTHFALAPVTSGQAAPAAPGPAATSGTAGQVQIY